jgi:hypothetical protein
MNILQFLVNMGSYDYFQNATTTVTSLGVLLTGDEYALISSLIELSSLMLST